jgi:hypothetical protein
MAERDTDRSDLRYEDPIEIANEFSLVRVRKVHTPNGERLEIEAPRRGGRLIRLDPLELESLACHDDESFLGSEVVAGLDQAKRDGNGAEKDERR